MKFESAKISFCYFLFFLFNIIFCSILVAEDDLQLKTIYIHATHLSTPNISNYNLDEYNSSIPFSDGADLLKNLPGVSASRFGGHGLEPFIRGQSAGQLNIVNDNSYTFGGCPNRMDPPTSYFNLQNDQQLEIVNGYQSVLNGFGGSGGSILIKQNLPKFEEKLSWKGNLKSGYDSNSQMWNASSQITAGDKHSYAQAYGSLKDSQNYQDGKGNEVRSSFREESGGMKFGFTPNENDDVSAGIDYNLIKDALFPGAGMDSPEAEGITFKTGLNKKITNSIIKKIELSGYASLVDHEMDNFSLRNRETPPFSVTESESDTFGARLANSLEIDQLELGTLLEWRRNNRNADRVMGKNPNNINSLQSILWPEITIDEVALALENIQNVTNSNRLIVGIRYDLVTVNYNRENETTPASGNKTPNDVYTQFYGEKASYTAENNFGGIIRLEHDYSSDKLIHLSFSRSVRTADTTERGLANYMGENGNMSWVGNPNIKPEKHHQVDTGVSVKQEKFNFSNSIYADIVQDYILRDSAKANDGVLVDFPNADIYRNVDTILTGLESDAALKIAPSLSINNNLSFTLGRNIESGEALPQIPPLHGKLGLVWELLENLNINSGLHWASKQNRADTDPLTGTGRDIGETSGYGIFELFATLETYYSAKINFGVTNLFDKNYANHLNRSNISDPTEVRVNEPGRSFFVTLNLPL